MSTNQIVGMVIGVLSDLGLLPYIQGMVILFIAISIAKSLYDMRG